jgi:hypothetical protein
MRYAFFIIIWLISTYTIVSAFFIPSALSSRPVNAWANFKVFSFDGETISFNLKIFVIGNYVDQNIWIMSEAPSSDAVYVEVRRGICDVVFQEGTNITVFSYSYSYNHSYYRAEPKLGGYLLFPCDKHSLVLYIFPSINITIDEHPWTCELPSTNYEGTFRITKAPKSDEPFRYKFELEINHSSSFTFAVSWLQWTTIGFTYTLSFVLTIIIILVFYKKANPSIGILTQVSSAIIFFIPAYEIAFSSLKSPLPLVLSDILMISAIPWNLGILIFAVWLNYKNGKLKNSISNANI